jgi:hypothetical protein
LPNQTFNSKNYWVDVAFVTSIGPDTVPPTVKSTTPGSGAAGIPVTAIVTVLFSENVANVTNATFLLSDGMQNVSATVNLFGGRTDGHSHTVGVSGVLDELHDAPRGGPGAISDTARNRMSAGYTWAFTTSAPPPPPPNEGPGGPILVVASQTPWNSG